MAHHIGWARGGSEDYAGDWVLRSSASHSLKSRAGSGGPAGRGQLRAALRGLPLVENVRQFVRSLASLGTGKISTFRSFLLKFRGKVADFLGWGGINVVIPHWTLLFLCTAYASPAVFLIAMLGASLGLMPLSDWYGVNRVARRESSVENLEAWFALEGCREIGQSQTSRFREPRR